LPEQRAWTDGAASSGGSPASSFGGRGPVVSQQELQAMDHKQQLELLHQVALSSSPTEFSARFPTAAPYCICMPCPAEPGACFAQSGSFPAPVLALSAVAREGGGSASEAGCRDSPPGSAGRRQGGSAYAISLARSERAPPCFCAPSWSRREIPGPSSGFAEVHLTQQGHRQSDADTLRRCDARRLKKRSLPALSPQP